MIRLGWSAWYMKGRMGNKAGSVGATRLKMGLKANLRSAFILKTRAQGDINKNREAKRWTRCVMEEARKFNEGFIGFEMYQRLT